MTPSSRVRGKEAGFRHLALSGDFNPGGVVGLSGPFGPREPPTALPLSDRLMRYAACHGDAAQTDQCNRFGQWTYCLGVCKFAHAATLEQKVTFVQELNVPFAHVTIGSMKPNETDLKDERLEAFAARLNEVCDKLRIPPKGQARQTSLATKFGVSQKGARKWLEAEGFPNLDMCMRLAEWGGVSFDWLMTGREGTVVYQTPPMDSAVNEPATGYGTERTSPELMCELIAGVLGPLGLQLLGDIEIDDDGVRLAAQWRKTPQERRRGMKLAANADTEPPIEFLGKIDTSHANPAAKRKPNTQRPAQKGKAS